MLIAGVDGCPKGWIVVVAEADDAGSLSGFEMLVVPTFKDLLVATRACDAVAVDIPIGLSDDCPRQADLLARRLLAPWRSSSVFPPPLRAVLACSNYRAACDLSASLCGKMMSKQAFNITPKIREADEALIPADQGRVIEAHPELAFARLNNGRPMMHNKKRLDGAEERAGLLSAAFGTDVRTWTVPRGAGRDDLYDAAVLVRTALRLTRGDALRLPSEPQYDARGLRMEIVY
jgi:predicted RNase H-like nuclease